MMPRQIDRKRCGHKGGLACSAVPILFKYILRCVGIISRVIFENTCTLNESLHVGVFWCIVASRGKPYRLL